MDVSTFAMSQVATHTNAEERALLRAAGFVHVTGLVATSFTDGRASRPIGHGLRLREIGRYGSNNSTDVIITTGGEVWLASHSDDSRQRNSEEIRAALTQLCPRGAGAWVPCSNGEHLNYRDLLKRVADPDYEPR